MKVLVKLILLIFILSFSNCIEQQNISEDDGDGQTGDTDPGESEQGDAIDADEVLKSNLAIPHPDTMNPDLNAVSESSSYFKSAIGDYKNYTTAAAYVLLSELSTILIIAPYYALYLGFADTLFNRPADMKSIRGEFKDDGTLIKWIAEIEDKVNFESTSVSFWAEFSATDLDPDDPDGKVSLEMKFRCKSPDDFCQELPMHYDDDGNPVYDSFTYFYGEAPKTKDENGYVKGAGFWSLKGPWHEDPEGRFTREIFRIDYNTKEVDALGESVATYVKIENTGTVELEYIGDVLIFCRLENDLTVNFYDADSKNPFEINHNDSTQSGSITSAVYNNGEESCWDQDHKNTECTFDPVSICPLDI